MFSLFSIVQFPNDACTTTSGTYTNGTCLTSSECTSKGGSVLGNCAAGFGVCCVFSVSASGTTVTENSTYIINPSYPSNYVPTSTPNTLTYTIAKCQDDICRVRLDFDTFEMTAPSSGGVADEGQCDTDRLAFTTTAQTVVPTTGATGTYGSYPYLCGTNTGLHAYLDLSPTSGDTATLTFTIGDSTSNQFKIKVTQLSCSDYQISQWQQCFQYFTGVTGTIRSYNYAQPQLLAAQQFNHCIRQEEDHCCIQYSPVSPSTFRMAGGRADTAAGTPCIGADAALLCSDGLGCSTDFLLIPNSGGSGVVGANAGSPSDRYCGPALSPFNAPIPQPVISCELPFVVSLQTSSNDCGGEAAGTTAGNCQNSQFQLTYRQIPGTC